MGRLQVSTRRRMLSVFKGMPVLPIVGSSNSDKFRKYSTTINQLVKNIGNIPFNVTPELLKIHDTKTSDVLNNSSLREAAKSALVSHIKIEDKNEQIIKIVSLSSVGAFFEYGVRPHEVYANYISVNGKPVADWIRKQGGDLTKTNSFIVGGPNSILLKPGIRFMEQGYKAAWNETPKITSKYINKI